ncbi:MAG: pyridine nucleotide-disulfide oxidoreductase [Actinomyces sp.]|nr:pyridine nucleotide-disulfide oxidoreductase [Actinomyces sp.]
MPGSAPWQRGGRAVCGARRGSIPVNNGAARPSRRLPQIDNPVLVGVAGLGALGVGMALRSLRPSHRGGRSERIRRMVTAAVEGDTAAHGDHGQVPSVDVQVHEAFGKPPLVSIDVHLEQPLAETVAHDLLDRVARAAWDNPELAPVAVRGRLLAAGPAGAEPTTTLADMTSLGYEDEIARPADLYARYGAPASDPRWRP